MFIVIGILLAGILVVGVLMQSPATKSSLVLATTTSTQDSGLLDYILPDFEAKYNADVYVIAVGTGQALEYGRRGDADVLLVHDPDKEKAFVADGYGVSRTLVAYNQFILIGPASDPAGISNASNVTDALQRIHDNGTTGNAAFITRGDNSGTYSKELKMWAAAKLNVSGFSNAWYVNASNGMGDTLLMCEEMDGYTLSDQATFFKLDNQGSLPHLDLLYQGDTSLFNQYSVIPVNMTKWGNANQTLALDFVSWITSDRVQGMIGEYNISGQVLFTPNAGPGANTDLFQEMNEGKEMQVASVQKG